MAKRIENVKTKKECMELKSIDPVLF